jgi:hypothetical protein
LQGPSKALVPSLGATCGRREREADAGNEEERSSPVPVVATVEGTQVYEVGGSLRGMSQERGSRSVRSTCVAGLFLHMRRTDDKRVSSGRTRRGTSSAYAKRAHSTPAGALITRPPQLEDTSFARSRDPCTSNATELGPVKSRKGWRGRFGIAVGQTWATRRNRHRDWAITDECAACRLSPPSQGGTRDGSEKEEGHGLRPCKEQREPRFGCSYVGMQLQKSSGGVGSQIRTHAALPKEWRCE